MAVAEHERHYPFRPDFHEADVCGLAAFVVMLIGPTARPLACSACPGKDLRWHIVGELPFGYLSKLQPQDSEF